MPDSDLIIDFVICWVDGNDPAWRQEKAKYTPNFAEDNSTVRFRDWDNLQYWFRGVEVFAPWVNKVHFVTWGHLPKWLNKDCPKLHIVNHRDYIPEKYLPTFSSRPIELNLHRIPGLAEHFVYFNDDMFLTNTVQKKDFFVDGLPTDFCITSTISTSTKDDIGPHVKLNNVGVLNSNFVKKDQMKKHFFKWINPAYGWNAIRNLIFYGQKRFRGFSNNHLPFSYLKATFEEVWAKEPEVLDDTCMRKFRNKQDVNQWLMRYWQMVKGNFHPIGRYDKGTCIELGMDNTRVYQAIESKRYKILCINDSDPNVDFEYTRDHLISSFQKILPEKSQFEL